MRIRLIESEQRQTIPRSLAVSTTGNWGLEIVKRNQPHRFVVPGRWIVERTLPGSVDTDV